MLVPAALFGLRSGLKEEIILVSVPVPVQRSLSLAAVAVLVIRVPVVQAAELLALRQVVVAVVVLKQLVVQAAAAVNVLEIRERLGLVGMSAITTMAHQGDLVILVVVVRVLTLISVTAGVVARGI